MTGFDYFKEAFIHNYANFSGRARRSEYWYFILFNSIISLIINGLAYVFENTSSTSISIINLTSWMHTGIVILPYLAVSVRRLHDTGKSGWLYFLILIPVVGAIILFVFFITEGTKGWNEYGEDPKGESYPVSGIEDQLV